MKGALEKILTEASPGPTSLTLSFRRSSALLTRFLNMVLVEHVTHELAWTTGKEKVLDRKSASGPGIARWGRR